MDLNQFVHFLDGIMIPDEKTQNECRSNIINLRNGNTLLFFNFALQVLNDPGNSLSRMTICLSAIKDMLSPTEVFSFNSIVNNWNKDFMAEIKSPLKKCIYILIHHKEIQIRNISASIFALIFAIESQKLEGSWPEIFNDLIKDFYNKDVIDFAKHGIMTFFHEVMILPIFPEQLKKREFSFIPFQFSGLLNQLIQNLHDPQANSKPIFDYSILLILDLIKYTPLIFDGEQPVKSLLDSYLYALPKTSPVQYGQLFEILLEIIKNSYQHMAKFFPVIFDYSVKGINCPTLDLVLISLEFWIDLCKYEKSIGSKSKKYTFTAMNSMMPLLLKLVANGKMEIKKEVTRLIRKFSELYFNDLSRLLIPVIKNLLYNDESIEDILVSLILIQGLCSHPTDCMNTIFERVCFIIKNSIDHFSENELMPSMLFQAIWAAEKIISFSENISNDERTIEFIINLLKVNLSEQISFSIYSLTKSLFKSSSSQLINRYFYQLFDNLFYSIDDLTENLLNANFNSLIELVRSAPNNSPAIQHSYSKFFESLIFNMQRYPEDPQKFENKLIGLLELISACINRMSSNDLSVISNDLVEKLILYPRLYSSTMIVSVLKTFDSICINLKKGFDFKSEIVINLIKYGFKSQSPEIIQNSIILCCDFLTFVNNKNVSLIIEMFDLIDNKISPFHIKFVIIDFIKYFANMYSKINLSSDEGYIFQWDKSYIDHFYEKVDQFCSMNIDSKYNRNFDISYYARLFESCFFAYAAYFKNAQVTKSNLQKAKKIINKIIVCGNMKAYDYSTVFALCEFLNSVIEKFRSDISISVNKRIIVEILNDIEVIKKSNKKYELYKDRIDTTLRNIKSIGGTPEYVQEDVL